MKNILSIGKSVLIITALIGASYQAYGIAKTDIQAPVLKSVSAVFNITDMTIAQKNANDSIKSIIDAMEIESKDTGSQEAKRLLERLKRQWESDHKRLNNAVNTRVQMLATMEKGHPLSML